MGCDKMSRTHKAVITTGTAGGYDLYIFRITVTICIFVF